MLTNMTFWIGIILGFVAAHLFVMWSAKKAT